jgi:hypothetical protein
VWLGRTPKSTYVLATMYRRLSSRGSLTIF